MVQSGLKNRSNITYTDTLGLIQRGNFEELSELPWQGLWQISKSQRQNSYGKIYHIKILNLGAILLDILLAITLPQIKCFHWFCMNLTTNLGLRGFPLHGYTNASYFMLYKFWSSYQIIIIHLLGSLKDARMSYVNQITKHKEE